MAACVQAPSTTQSQSEIAPGSLGLGEAPAPQLQPDWWKEFHDPQLDRLVDQMLAKNPTLQGALARIRAAEAEVSSARSQQYPSINIDGSDTLQLVSKEFVYPQRFGGTWQWVGDVQARLRWSLDFWGKQAALIDRARNVRQAIALDASAARLARRASSPIPMVTLRCCRDNLRSAQPWLRPSLWTDQSVFIGLENEASRKGQGPVALPAGVSAPSPARPRCTSIPALPPGASPFLHHPASWAVGNALPCRALAAIFFPDGRHSGGADADQGRHRWA